MKYDVSTAKKKALEGFFYEFDINDISSEATTLKEEHMNLSALSQLEKKWYQVMAKKYPKKQKGKEKKAVAKAAAEPAAEPAAETEPKDDQEAETSSPDTAAALASMMARGQAGQVARQAANAAKNATTKAAAAAVAAAAAGQTKRVHDLRSGVPKSVETQTDVSGASGHQEVHRLTQQLASLQKQKDSTDVKLGEKEGELKRLRSAHSTAKSKLKDQAKQLRDQAKQLKQPPSEYKPRGVAEAEEGLRFAYSRARQMQKKNWVALADHELLEQQLGELQQQIQELRQRQQTPPQPSYRSPPRRQPPPSGSRFSTGHKRSRGGCVPGCRCASCERATVRVRRSPRQHRASYGPAHVHGCRCEECQYSY